MKITRYVNGQPKERSEIKEMQISSEIISSTIEMVNKRNAYLPQKGLNTNNE
ncbi:MAG: hypothetical protein IKV88_07625 [Clostridia bacterium]|nr:hypothetical protein [Clostridia bacterium]